MKKNSIGIISLIFLSTLGACHQEGWQQVNMYYSLDSLFSVDIPSNYSLSVPRLPNYLCFNSEDNHFILTIEKNTLIQTDDFHEWVKKQMEPHNSSKFTIHIMEKKDSIVHYKASSGLFYAHNIYLKKRIGVHDYLFTFSYNMLRPNNHIIRNIYSSLKEYNIVSFSANTFNDNSYTYYYELGFAIKRTYQLNQNHEFIHIYNKLYADQHKASPLLAAYICAQNIDSNYPEDITIINVNINKALSPNAINEYASSLKCNKINYRQIKWQGNPALEYGFSQHMGEEINIPTRAIYCYYNEKLYLIQLASLSNLDSKYKKLKQSFMFIKQ